MTHFVRATNVDKLGLELRQCQDHLVKMALELQKEGEAKEEQFSAAVRNILKDRLRNHNCQLKENLQDELLAHDYMLNA